MKKILKLTSLGIMFLVIVGVFFLKNIRKTRFYEKKISMIFTKESELLKVKLQIINMQVFLKKSNSNTKQQRKAEPQLKLIGSVEIQNKSNSNIEYNLSGVILKVLEERCPTELNRPYIYVRYNLKKNELKKYSTYWLIFSNQMEQINKKNIEIVLDNKILRIKLD